jgi:hypothetical protein
MENTTSIVSTEYNTVVNTTVNTNTIILANSDTLVNQETTNTILVERLTANTVLAGQVGPVGPQGPISTSEEDTMYSKRIDTINDSLLYRAEALVGASESDLVWRIRQITIVSDDISETWASGTANFDKSWALRASYTYT